MRKGPPVSGRHRPAANPGGAMFDYSGPKA